MTWLNVAYAFLALALFLLACDQLAAWRHWRVGRWGQLLSLRRNRVGEGCLRCETDYRYVYAHPTPYMGKTKEDARVLIPLCTRCWYELPIGGRLRYYGLLLSHWRQSGALTAEEWDETRTAVYAAVMAGL